jgi:hypothetical protein
MCAQVRSSLLQYGLQAHNATVANYAALCQSDIVSPYPSHLLLQTGLLSVWAHRLCAEHPPRHHLHTGRLCRLRGADSHSPPLVQTAHLFKQVEAYIIIMQDGYNTQTSQHSSVVEQEQIHLHIQKLDNPWALE